MASICDHKHWAFIFTFVPVFGLWSLNYVAGELEMPFGDDPNDLPLTEFQHHMNKSMMMLIREESDIVPTTGPGCAKDWDVMKTNITTQRPRDFIHEIAFIQKKDKGMAAEEEVAVVVVAKADPPP